MVYTCNASNVDHGVHATFSFVHHGAANKRLRYLILSMKILLNMHNE
jgi:hypothetical protein